MAQIINMIQTLIGQKIEQTQKFLENGKRVPVTKVAISDNVVVQVKTVEKDMYTAVQLGWGFTKNPTKPTLGHAKKAKLVSAPKVLREVRVADATALPEPGETIALETVFKPGDIVDVSGVSKGKGFAGGVKRYHFRGGPKTHGQSDRHRAPGSIGQGTTPGRVYKGKKMAGHMGVDVVTVKNLSIVDVDAANKAVYVLGLIPGYKKATVVLTVRGEMKKFVPLLQVEQEKPEKPAASSEDVVASEVSVAEKTEEQKEEVAVSATAETETKEESASDTSKEAQVEEKKEVTEGKEDGK